MKEEFVTSDIAFKLKEKGFEWDKITTYNPITKVRNNHLEPTISQALKWLREEKKIHIDIGIWDCKYIPFIVYIDVLDENIVHTNKTVDVDDHKLFDTYEQAVIAGVEFVLNNLI